MGNHHLFDSDDNPQLASTYFHQAATLGHPESLGVLGFCYEFGLGGTEKDFGLAEHYYLEAATHLDGLGMARLAFLRKYGRPNIKIDRSESEEWAKRVERQQKRHNHDTIRWIRQGAERYNHPACQYVLGVCYHDGIGVAKDEQLAFRWYRASAEQGNERGQGILGYCYGEGFGVAKDEIEAMRWYRLAAAKDETVAIYNVGYCYEEGIGVDKNVATAVDWYRRSAEQGNAFAQNSLGYCYEDGIGVGQDFALATHWYEQSAEQGYPWAECNLGYCYQNGIGVDKCDRLSAYW